MGSGEKKKQMQKQKNSEGGEGKRQMITDERFAAAQSDPRFMEAPKKRSKVSIDSRFNRVFTDKRFASSNAPTDKRGKPNNNKKPASSLKHYYSLKQHEEEGKAKPPMEEEEKDSGNETETETDSESEKSNDSLEEDDSDLDESSFASSSGSDSDSDSHEQYVDEEEEDTFLQPDDVPEIEQETRRLAVVNLDWGQVRAVDLYVLLSSFLPKGGQIISVSVYPSEFGLKRMAEEAVHGPVGLFDEEESEDGEDDEIDSKKLRAYELSKLKYYYAVVECDSIATADYLYTTCDGVEFERSANKLDLRFIPDSMDFKHDPRDVATEAPAEYEGLNFQTRALQHSNVELTWDEDEPHREKTLKRNLTDEQLSELELKEILASDESESDDVKKVNEYRALIQSGNASDEEHDDDNDHDMEVTFNSGLEDISKRILEKKDKKSETVWEAHLRKRMEKKKASKNRSKYSSEEDNSDTDREHVEEADDFFVHEPSATEGKGDQGKRYKRAKTNQESNQEEGEATTAELELLLAADDQGPDANLKGYNLKPKKGKGKKGNGVPDMEKLPSATDYEDPRFSSLFTSPLFALDPTDPQFKRSATYVRQVAKKQKVGDQERVGQTNDSDIPVEASREKDRTEEESGRMSRIKEKYELSSLVKLVKMKSKELASSQSQGRMRRPKSRK